jgi:hypothetical protein
LGAVEGRIGTPGLIVSILNAAVHSIYNPTRAQIPSNQLPPFQKWNRWIFVESD